MAKQVTEKVKTKSGKWEGTSVLPQAVNEAYISEYPDWDWQYISEGNGVWLVVRLYEEGEEFERMACKVISRRAIG
jgi:hypothetical protein